MNPPTRCDLIASRLFVALYGACVGVACGGSVHATAGPDASGSTNAPDASADSTVNFGADADADDGAPPGDAADLQDARFLVAPPDAEAGLP
jgi:hypothetical protein